MAMLPKYRVTFSKLEKDFLAIKVSGHEDGFSSFWLGFKISIFIHLWCSQVVQRVFTPFTEVNVAMIHY